MDQINQITAEEEARQLAMSLPPSDFDSHRAIIAVAGLITRYRVAVAAAVASRQYGWTCFHCGDRFQDEAAARDHFGFEQSQDPGCRIKLGAERSLLHSLREAERSAAEAWSLLHDESAEGMKAYRAAQGRHGQQVTAAEELGYERGLRDARREYAGLLTHVSALLDALDADCFWRPHHPGLPQKDTAAAYEADRGQHSMTYGHIRAVAAALADAMNGRHPTISPWQPIETAPKDGTIIDLWVEELRFPECFWGRPDHTCGEAGRYCECCPTKDDWVDSTTGQYVFDADEGGNGIGDRLSHWMPVPVPPTVRQSGSDKNA